MVIGGTFVALQVAGPTRSPQIGDRETTRFGRPSYRPLIYPFTYVIYPFTYVPGAFSPAG